MLSLLLGILGTWAVAHIYFKLTCRDQNLLYEKLTDRARRWILEDQRKQLSVADLNELLQEKTIDPDSDYSLPYKVCLNCGSENIRRGSDVDVDEDVTGEGEPLQIPIYYDALQCEECGWRISQRNHVRGSNDAD